MCLHRPGIFEGPLTHPSDAARLGLRRLIFGAVVVVVCLLVYWQAQHRPPILNRIERGELVPCDPPSGIPSVLVQQQWYCHQ